MILLNELKDILSYDLDTGEWHWLKNMTSRARAGTVAGTVRKDGYVQITINKKIYLAHRLAWFYVIGDWPPCKIDHKNCQKTDNRWNNLRLASDEQNAANRKLGKTNTTGHKGVYLDRRTGRWYAECADVYLGTFPTKEEAAEAYVKAASLRYGEYANAGQ